MLDADGTCGGRGANICASGECFEKAIEKGSFNRAWGVTIPREAWDDVREDLIALVEKRTFRGSDGSVVHRVSKEEAEKLLHKKVTRS